MTTPSAARARPAEPALERVRDIVLRHGWNATAYQLVNPGLEYWFAAAGDAVVGFVTRHGTRVVAGAPICAAERLAEVCAEFERDADARGEKVLYFHAAERLERVFHESPTHATVVIGAQPSWDPTRWPDILSQRASLRAQLNRARNKGVRVEEWSAEQATGNTALERCLREWLATRHLPPLHFLVEPETLGRLFDRRVFVATRDGRPVGFLVASPVPARDGWLVEQIIRGRRAPNGTAELLVDAAMRAMAAGGARYLTLGLVPLSQRAEAAQDRNPFWLRALLAWVRAHGRRFYNFAGLESFKAKLLPDTWEPIYTVIDRPRFGFWSLYAIAAAFAEGSPVLMVLRAMLRAVRQELRWLAQRWARRGEHRREHRG